MSFELNVSKSFEKKIVNAVGQVDENAHLKKPKKILVNNEPT
jgi:hypothetical protein